MSEEKFKVVEPIVLSKEVSDSFDEIGKSIREEFFSHRNREINEMLKPYGLTLDTVQEAGYVVAVQKTIEENFDIFVLAKVETKKRLTSLEEFIDQVMKNSGL